MEKVRLCDCRSQLYHSCYCTMRCYNCRIDRYRRNCKKVKCDGCKNTECEDGNLCERCISGDGCIEENLCKSCEENECKAANFCKNCKKNNRPNFSILIDSSINYNLLESIDKQIEEEEDRERLFSYGNMPDIPISFSAIMARASSIVNLTLTEKDYYAYRKLFKKYDWSEKVGHTFSITLDIIVCKKFQKIFKIYQKFHARLFKMVVVDCREPGKEKMSLRMRCKTDSFLDSIGSSGLTKNNLNENGEYILRFKDYGFTQRMLILYSEFSIVEMGDAARYQLISRYLDAEAHDYNLFCKARDDLVRMFEMFIDFARHFHKIYEDYIGQYVVSTLNLDDKKSSFIKRLSLFCDTYPGVAKLIWTTYPQFNTERARSLIAANYLPGRKQSAFIRCQAFDKLCEHIKLVKTKSVPTSDRWVYELKDMGEKGLRLYDELCEMLEWRSRDPDVKRMISAQYDSKYNEARSFYDKFDKSKLQKK